MGSQYALMPSAAQDSFGDKYASINIGFVYMSTVIATVSSALLSQYLTIFIGWEGMIYLIGLCAFVDFVSTFFMPANPHKQLQMRYKQFYVDNTDTKSSNDQSKKDDVSQDEDGNHFYENLGYVHHSSDPMPCSKKKSQQIVLIGASNLSDCSNTQDEFVQIKIAN